MIALPLLVIGIINLLWVSSWTATVLHELTPRAFEKPPRDPVNRFPSLAIVLLALSLIQLVALAGYGITGNPYHKYHQWIDDQDSIMFPLTFGLVIALVFLVCRVFFQFGKIAQLYDFKRSNPIYRYGMDAFEERIDPEQREQILANRKRE